MKLGPHEILKVRHGTTKPVKQQVHWTVKHGETSTGWSQGCVCDLCREHQRAYYRNYRRSRGLAR